MARALDVDTSAALAVGAVRLRNFLRVVAHDRADWSEVAYCFWDDADTVTTNVIDENGDSVSHTFNGDGAIVSMDPMPMRVGLDVRTVQVVMSPLHATVQEMVRDSDPRGADVEIYRGLLATGSGLLVAPPRIRFLGKINEAPISTAAAGGESTVTLRVVSHTRELTRTNPAKKSDAQQQLRSGDRFRRYAGVVADWDVWWGEAKSSD